jgi:hypothetical protein
MIPTTCVSLRSFTSIGISGEHESAEPSGDLRLPSSSSEEDCHLHVSLLPIPVWANLRRIHAACCASLSLLDRTLGRLTCVFDDLSMYEHSCTVSLLRRLWNHHQEIVVSLPECNGYTSVIGFSYGIRKYLPCRMRTICYSDGTSCHAADEDASVSYQARFTRYPQITSRSIL